MAMNEQSPKPEGVVSHCDQRAYRAGLSNVLFWTLDQVQPVW
jgi:hypothetical protein